MKEFSKVRDQVLRIMSKPYMASNYVQNDDYTQLILIPQPLLQASIDNNVGTAVDMEFISYYHSKNVRTFTVVERYLRKYQENFDIFSSEYKDMIRFVTSITQIIGICKVLTYSLYGVYKHLIDKSPLMTMIVSENKIIDHHNVDNLDEVTKAMLARKYGVSVDELAQRINPENYLED